MGSRGQVRVPKGWASRQSGRWAFRFSGPARQRGLRSDGILASWGREGQAGKGPQTLYGSVLHNQTGDPLIVHSPSGPLETGVGKQCPQNWTVWFPLPAWHRAGAQQVPTECVNEWVRAPAFITVCGTLCSSWLWDQAHILALCASVDPCAKQEAGRGGCSLLYGLSKSRSLLLNCVSFLPPPCQ